MKSPNGRQALFAAAALLVVNVVFAAEMEGNWTGTLVQGPARYPVQISFAQSRTTVAYPSLGCTGTLIPVRSEGKVFNFTERIERGGCENNGRVEIRPMNGTSVSFRYYDRLNNLTSGVLAKAK